jgi:hypothetical protein
MQLSGYALDRRKRDSQVGSLVVYDGTRIDSRVGAAVGMMSLGGNFEEWGKECEGRLPELTGRSVVLVDVGVSCEILSSIKEDKQAIILVESSAASAALVRKCAGARTKLIAGLKHSAGSMVWMGLVGKDTQKLPNLMRGMDWLGVGEETDEGSIRVAMGAMSKQASVAEIVRYLQGDIEIAKEWEEAGDAEAARLQRSSQEWVAVGRYSSLGGAKIYLANSERGIEGAVAAECERFGACIGASWTSVGGWVEVILKGGFDSNLRMLCGAYGGYGEGRNGRISLSWEALDLLRGGRLGALDARHLNSRCGASEGKQVKWVSRDDICVSAASLSHH